MTTEELTKKYLEADERITRHTEQIKTCFNQIAETRDMAESVHKLATSIEILTVQQKASNDKIEASNTKIDTLTSDVEEIKSKPAKKWDNAVWLVVTAIIGAILGMLLHQIGLE